jgi:hypothetical protein
VLIALLDKDPLTRADHASTRAGLLAALGSDPLNFSALSFGSLNAGSLTSGSLKSGSLNSGSLNSGSLNSGRTAVGTMQSTRLRTAVVVSTAAAALLALCLVVYGLGLNLLDGTEPATARPPAAIAPIRSSNLTPIRATVGPGTFSIAVPTGWSRSGGNYVRFTDPTGKVWIQLYAERGEGQLDVWAAADRRATRGGGNLHHYRGAQSFPTAPLGPLAGNDWQYSYLRDGESERRLVIDRGAVADGVSYQVALSAPVSQFARYRPILDKVTKSFRIG